MGIGLSKLLIRVNVHLNCFIFKSRKLLLGFENANAFLRTVDKHSIQAILKQNGAEIGDNCDIEAPLIFHNCQNFSNLIIRKNCHIGKNCFFDLRDKVVIYENVVISMQCTFITHIDMNKSELHHKFPALQAAIHIGKNCYVGANSTILHGVKLAEGCFLAAGTVVNKDTEPFSMVGGVPAKLIKSLSKQEKNI